MSLGDPEHLIMSPGPDQVDLGEIIERKNVGGVLVFLTFRDGDNAWFVTTPDDSGVPGNFGQSVGFVVGTIASCEKRARHYYKAMDIPRELRAHLAGS